MIYPIIYLLGAIKTTAVLIYDMLLPVQVVVQLFFGTVWGLTTSVFYLPFYGLYLTANLLY